MEKMKKKYKDQDEEEREMRLMILGSRGKKIEPAVEAEPVQDIPVIHEKKTYHKNDDKARDEDNEEKDEEAAIGEDSEGKQATDRLMRTIFQPCVN